jgi:hypothetical protein
VRGFVLIRQGWMMGLDIYYFALLIGKKEEKRMKKTKKTWSFKKIPILFVYLKK